MVQISNSKKIVATYDNDLIRVYQAYNNKIADEALRLGHFGNCFKFDRTTWIKPSFLWMMYRSDWGRNENQERILAIDLKREQFDFILSNVILSKYNCNLYSNQTEWKKQQKCSEVVCQWDPDRDIYGNPKKERAIQLGLKKHILFEYATNWIQSITDITNNVSIWREQRSNKTLDISLLPVEREYPIKDKVAHILGIPW